MLTLTKAERLILANQYKLLALLDKNSGEDYERAREAMESGYSAAIEGLLQAIFDELSPPECRLVILAMDMFGALQNSYDALKDNSAVKETDVRFPGFDGNNETKYMTYARYIVEHERRFTYLKPVSRDFNSHMPMVPRYRQMLTKWEGPLQQSHEMSEDQIRELLER